MINTVSVIVRHPVGDERCTLGLRTAFATQSGGYTTHLIFIGDGVYTLMGSIAAYLAKMMARFVENEGRLFCFDEDLEQRGIDQKDLTVKGVEIANRDHISHIIEESDTVNAF